MLEDTNSLDRAHITKYNSDDNSVHQLTENEQYDGWYMMLPYELE